MKHDNLPVRSISAFERSVNADDWRELMRLYLVRRTRSFIKSNYAHTDPATGRKYLEFANGAKSFFPDRIPKKVTFSMSTTDAKDQYAKLYADDIVGLIDTLSLPRYTMLDYVSDDPRLVLSSAEQQVMDNLSRAGHRTKGFCRTNLFKRLESCGYSFMLSVSRLMLRNFIVEYAAVNKLPIPIGGTTASIELDSDLFSEFDAYGDTEDDADILPGDVFGFSLEEYRRRAELLYHDIYKNQRKRFQWVRADMFDCEKLANDLCDDNMKLHQIVEMVPVWNPAEDRKLDALATLLSKVHSREKAIIFTQYSDTAAVFDFFDTYEWHLDSRECASGNEISPDVLGFIFEKYINDRSKMGAYYTQEDITEYIGRNSIIPYLLFEVERKYKDAFAPDREVWTHLKESGDKYIFDAIKTGVIEPLPDYISQGISTTEPDLHGRRSRWNEPADANAALPAETWREVVDRRRRYTEILEAIQSGKITSVQDFITYNLDI